MANATIEVKMKSKTGKGIAGADKVWYNTGKNVNFDGIEKGDTVDITYVEANGVNFVSGYKVKSSDSPTAQQVISAIPSLPKTTVTETKAPGGDRPIAPAAKPVGDPDKMSKADWAAKDRSIETQAVLKSVLESPAYAQLIVGKRTDEAFEIGNNMFHFFLEKFNEAKNG